MTRSIRGTEVHNRVTATWVLNHQFLELRMRDVAQPPKYEAIVLIGCIVGDKQYVAHWTDAYGGKFGAWPWRADGRRDRVPIRLPRWAVLQYVAWTPERQQWVFRMESVGADGKRRLFATDSSFASSELPTSPHGRSTTQFSLARR